MCLLIHTNTRTNLNIYIHIHSFIHTYKRHKGRRRYFILGNLGKENDKGAFTRRRRCRVVRTLKELHEGGTFETRAAHNISHHRCVLFDDLDTFRSCSLLSSFYSPLSPSLSPLSPLLPFPPSPPLARIQPLFRSNPTKSTNEAK